MESHELRLIINAAAAKAGGKQFVSAIRQVQEAVRVLDRDAAGSFTKLRREADGAAKSARAAGKAIGGAGKEAAAGARGAADAMGRQSRTARDLLASQLQIQRQTNDMAAAFSRLRASMFRSGDNAGILALSNAMTKYQQTVSQTGLTQRQLRAATEELKASMSGTKARIAAASAEMAKQAAQARRAADATRQAGVAGQTAAAGFSAAGTAASRANSGFRQATGGLRGLENAFNGSFQAASLFRTAIGGITLGTFTASVFRAGDALEQFRITMEVASGSAEAAAGDLAFIDNMAARLGINLTGARNAFSKFAVSSDIAGVSGNITREIFESVSTAMAVLGRGTQDQELAFLALEQMMSKGVISAEELRRQLGERLPGAVNIMARAVGVSTAELQNMLKAGELISADVLPLFARELNRIFGGQIDRTFNRAGSNLQRLQVEFQKLLEIVAESGFLDTLSREFRDLTTLMRSSDVQEAARTLGEGMARAAEIGADALTFLIENIETVGAVAKAVFGGILVRQTALAVAALGSMVVASTRSAAAMVGFGTATRTMVATQTAATASTTALGGAFTGLVTRLTAGGAAARAAAVGLRAVGGALTLMTGPIGAVITALTLLPLLFSDAGDSAVQTSAVYEDAMRRMGAANFSFIDTARQVEEATAFEQLADNLVALSEARALIDEVAGSRDIERALDRAFSTMDSSVMTEATRNSVEAIQDMIRAFSQLESGSTEAQAKINEIKTAIEELRASGGLSEELFSGLRAAEDAILPLTQAFLTLNGLQAENAELAPSNAAEFERLALVQDEVRVAMEGLIFGTRDFNATQAETQAILSGFSDGTIGLQAALADLSSNLNRVNNTATGTGVRFSEVQAALDRASFSADGSAESIAQVQQALDDARAAVERVRATDVAGEFDAQTAAAEAEINSVQSLVDALVSLDGTSNAAAAAQGNLQGAVNAAGGAMATSTAVAYDYAAALAVVAQAQAAVAGVATNFREQAALRVELSTLEGEARAVFQDRFFGTTSRAVNEIETAIADAERQLAGFEGTPQDGAAEYLRSSLEGLRAERDAIIAEGARATSSIFENNAARQEAARQRRASSGGGRRGGGGKSKTAKQLEEEQRAYERAEEALMDYVDGLNEESVALALVASGRASSVQAAKLLIDAQNAGVIATDEQAAAFLRQAEAAEELNRRMNALANDPVKKWLDSVPTWLEAGQTIERDVFQSLSDEIANFIQTGEFSFERLGASILASVSKIVADKAVKELVNLLGGGENGFGLGGLLDGLFSSIGDPETSGTGFNGQEQAVLIQNAMRTGGQEAAEIIRQAMAGGAQQMRAGVQQGTAAGGQQLSSGVQQGAAVGSNQLRTGVATGAAAGAPRLSSGVVQGANQGAPVLAQGVMQGSQAGGGFIQQILGSVGGGGGGGFGGILSTGLSLLGGLFSEGGISTSPVATAPVPVAAFRNAPHFTRGTTNTSGIPAILHDNEAVYPTVRQPQDSG